MLRNCKKIFILSCHQRLGHIYPSATCREITRHGQISLRRTFVSCNHEIEKFCIPLTDAGSTFKHHVRKHSQQSEPASPNRSIDAISEVKSNVSREINPDWTVHERLISCAGFSEGNRDGSNFIVGYVDTASQLTKAEKSRMPTVLAVARDLAHSDSLRPLLESLARSGFRIIMPHLVGSELTRGLIRRDDEQFSQMLGERSAFLLDFLSSTGIQRFDLVLGHCLECFPILTLASNFQIFDSVVFICPIPGHVSPRWIHPLKISLKMIDWFKSSIFWPFAALYFHTYVRNRVSAYRDATAKQLHSCVEISHGINYDTVSGFATMFESRRIPFLYIYCDADPMVDSKLSAEYAEIFGLSPDLTDSYNAEGQLVEKANRTSARYAKAVCFSARTHFPHKEKYLRDIILKELTELYNDALAKRTRKGAG